MSVGSLGSAMWWDPIFLPIASQSDLLPREGFVSLLGSVDPCLSNAGGGDRKCKCGLALVRYSINRYCGYDISTVIRYVRFNRELQRAMM